MASIEGNFASPFPANVYDDGENGPSVEIVYFNTKANDEDNDFGDLNLTANFDWLYAPVGVAMSQHNIATTLNFNQSYRRLECNRSGFDQ